MLKKIICIIASLTFAAACFAGCSNNNQNTTTLVEEKSDTKEIIHGNGHKSEELDLKLCADNVVKMFMEGDYKLNDMTIEIPTDQNDFFNIIFVSEEKPEDESVYIDWINKCLRALNDEAIKQDPEFSPSDEGYYGGLFDQYNVQITAMCIEEILSRWPVNQKIEAGSHDPVVTNNDIIDLSQFS